MELKINKAVKFYIRTYETGWQRVIIEGIITRFHFPGWVTIRANDKNYYVEYSAIISE